MIKIWSLKVTQLYFLPRDGFMGNNQVMKFKFFICKIKWKIFKLLEQVKIICLMVPQTVTVLCNLSWHCWQWGFLCQTSLPQQAIHKNHSVVWPVPLHLWLASCCKHYGCSRATGAKKGVDKAIGGSFALRRTLKAQDMGTGYDIRKGESKRDQKGLSEEIFWNLKILKPS